MDNEICQNCGDVLYPSDDDNHDDDEEKQLCSRCEEQSNEDYMYCQQDSDDSYVEEDDEEDNKEEDEEEEDDEEEEEEEEDDEDEVEEEEEEGDEEDDDDDEEDDEEDDEDDSDSDEEEFRAKRCYGFFQCPSCRHLWESSYVFCKKEDGILTALYGQDCKRCLVGCLPFKVERLLCSRCGDTSCQCDKRHVDVSKPHRSDLCHKCLSGHPCR